LEILHHNIIISHTSALNNNLHTPSSIKPVDSNF
jgi:hypothetical protein